MQIPKCPWNGATGGGTPKSEWIIKNALEKVVQLRIQSNGLRTATITLRRGPDVLGYFHEIDIVDDSWNELNYTCIVISEFGWLGCSFSFFSLLYIIVCNELAFGFLYILSYLFPLVLSYASFSSYDTRVALDYFSSSLCCRIYLKIYSSSSPTRRANTLTRLSYPPRPNRVSLHATPARG